MEESRDGEFFQDDSVPPSARSCFLQMQGQHNKISLSKAPVGLRAGIKQSQLLIRIYQLFFFPLLSEKY